MEKKPKNKLLGASTPEKLRLFPYIDDLLKTARYMGEELPKRTIHLRKGVKIHRFENFVTLDDKKFAVQFVVREAHDGKLVYELFEYSRFCLKPHSFKHDVAGGSALFASNNIAGEEKELNIQLISIEDK